MSRFDKKEASFKSDPIETPYNKARQEWDLRIGSARVQARSWRMAFFVMTVLCIFSALQCILLINKNQNHVFVARVTNQGEVLNVLPMTTAYKPEEREYQYFIKQFIEKIGTISMDPVLVKKQWQSAYQFVHGKAITELNGFAKSEFPNAQLGEITQEVIIENILPVTDHTYQARWQTVQYDRDGHVVKKINWQGILVIQVIPPRTQAEIFENPLGIEIVDMHLEKSE